MIRVLILTCWQNQKAKSLWVPCKRWRMSLIPSFKTTHMSAQTHRQTVTLCPSMPASLQAALHQVSLILSSTLCETSPLPKDPLAEMILTPQPAPTWGQKIRPMVLPTSSPPVVGPGQQFYNTLQYPVQLCQNGLTLIACDTGGICTKEISESSTVFLCVKQLRNTPLTPKPSFPLCTAEQNRPQNMLSLFFNWWKLH